MRRALLLLLPALLLTGAADPEPVKPPAAPPGSEKLCGWVVYSTGGERGRLVGRRTGTGNWWLVDPQTRTDSGWLIRAPGGYAAAGFDILLKDLKRDGPEWHVAKEEAGYRCACLQARTDRRNRQITRIYQVSQAPIAQCKGRRELPRPL